MFTKSKYLNWHICSLTSACFTYESGNLKCFQKPWNINPSIEEFIQTAQLRQTGLPLPINCCDLTHDIRHFHTRRRIKWKCLDVQVTCWFTCEMWIHIQNCVCPFFTPRWLVCPVSRRFVKGVAGGRGPRLPMDPPWGWNNHNNNGQRRKWKFLLFYKTIF